MTHDAWQPPQGVVPENVDPLFETVADAVTPWLGADPTGHGLAHAWRVFNTAMALADDVPSADREVLGAAALVHDIHRAMGLEHGEFVHPEDSLDEVEAVLSEAGFPAAKRDDVLHCVALHEEYEFREVDRREASDGASGAAWRPASRGDRRDGDRVEVDLLRDADNLDAMGAVGVARCFAYTGAHERPMWTGPEGPDSAVEHFETKLLNLREELQTDAARAVAADRHAFLETFLERFREEWRGRA